LEVTDPSHQGGGAYPGGKEYDLTRGESLLRRKVITWKTSTASLWENISFGWARRKGRSPRTQVGGFLGTKSWGRVVNRGGVRRKGTMKGGKKEKRAPRGYKKRCSTEGKKVRYMVVSALTGFPGGGEPPQKKTAGI